jgi:hypothetical protein
MKAATSICAAMVMNILITPAAFGVTVCNVAGIGVEFAPFQASRCSGRLDHSEAVDCVNRLARELEDQRHRAELVIAQAECLCGALNEIAGAFGHYSRIGGSCTVEK